MKGKWYAVPTISILFLIVSGLVSCAPTTTFPASSPDESGVPSPEASLPYESGASETPTNLELYYCGEPFSEECFITLKTIKSLRGNSPIREYITVNQSPWIVNYNWKQTSSIGYECSVDVWEGKVGPHSYADSAGGLGFPNHASKTLEDVYCVKVYKTGDFTIQVEASGCEWWVKVGVEPNRGAPNPYQRMIIGKWQYGISDCPPSIDKSLCEKLKKLPENKLYYLEFFEDGQVNRIENNWKYSGRYGLIGGSKLEINWIFGGYVAYDIGFSGDKMVLVGQGGAEGIFRRVD